MNFRSHTEEIPFAKAIWEERPREAEKLKQNLLARLDPEGPLKTFWNVGLYSKNNRKPLRRAKEMFEPLTCIGSTLARPSIR